MRFIAVAILVFLFWGSSSYAADMPFNLITSEGAIENVKWTKEELEQGIAKRRLIDTEDSTHFLIRLNSSEKPHIHDDHDLFVILIKGRVMMHFSEHSAILKPGDFVHIKKGEVHWAENVGLNAATAYVVYSPKLGVTNEA